MREIKRIFVHCTAGPQNQTIQAIQNYWKNVNKWKDPGYHYIIKPDGEIVPLQPEEKPSNGVAGYNSTAINVCYIGGVDSKGKAIDNRTDAQKASLRLILTQLKNRYPNAEIMGHRDIWGSDPKKWKKMCPCFDAKTEYADITGEMPELVQPELNLPMEEPVDPELPEVNIVVEEPKELETTKEEPIATTADTVEQPKTTVKQKKPLLTFLFDCLIDLIKLHRNK